MVAKGKAEREFTSPAGSLTLLRAGGWSERLDLLGLLELTRHEGLGLLLNTWEEPCGATRDPARRRPMGGWSKLDAKHARTVTDSLARWLGRRPGGPLALGAESIEALVAMACCWSTAITHVLADGPLTVEQVAEQVNSIYSEEIVLEHIELLVSTGQAERFQELGQPHRFRLTEWGAEALVPLIAAARRETHLPEDDIMAPEILDVEATFKLVAQMLRLPADVAGTCHLGVSLAGDEPVVAGARIDVAGGSVLSTSILLEADPENWVRGTPREWCDVVVEPATARPLRRGGDPKLTGALIDALHECLFGNDARQRPPLTAK